VLAINNHLNAKKVRQMFVETTRILLRARSKSNIIQLKKSIECGLTYLLRSMIVPRAADLPVLVSDKFGYAYQNQVKICVVLTELLIKYESCRIEQLLYAAKELVQVCEMTTNILTNFDPYNR